MDASTPQDNTHNAPGHGHPPAEAGHAHDGHTHHHDHSNELNPKDTPAKSTISASFWFGMLLIALFIAGVNFVGIMASGHGEEGKGSVHEKQETTSNATMQGHNQEDKVSEDKEHNSQFHPPATENDPEHHGGAGE